MYICIYAYYYVPDPALVRTAPLRKLPFKRHPQICSLADTEITLSLSLSIGNHSNI